MRHGVFMKFMYFANNKLALNVLKWLIEGDDELVGLAIHPNTKQKYANEIVALSKLPSNRIFLGTEINKEEKIKEIRMLKPDIGLSVLFDYKLQHQLRSVFPKKCINLHTSLLPYNRGQYPNVWSIIEETPAGVSLHFMDDQIDTGDVISQSEVKVETTDTGETLYLKLEKAGFELLCNSWTDIKSGTIKPKRQDNSQATQHRRDDVENIDEIKLENDYKARELIDILRARTFPPYDGAYFEKDGERILITSIIDNLIKGAAGQAIQNMNLMFGLDEDLGLKLKSSFF